MRAVRWQSAWLEFSDLRNIVEAWKFILLDERGRVLDQFLIVRAADMSQALIRDKEGEALENHQQCQTQKLHAIMHTTGHGGHETIRIASRAVRGGTGFAPEQKHCNECDVDEDGDEKDGTIGAEVTLYVVQCANRCADDSHDADQSEATIEPLDQGRHYDAAQLERGADDHGAHDHNTQDEMHGANRAQRKGYRLAKDRRLGLHRTLWTFATGQKM